MSIEFLPWHRAWSHSLLLGIALGVLLAVLMDARAGFVAGLGFCVHVLEDQLGHMGSNLFWPLTRERSSGLKLLHSGDTLPNMATVWLSLTLLLLNLDRASDVPLLDLTSYLLFVVIAPVALMLGIYARRRWQRHASRETARMAHEQRKQHDILAEDEAFEAS